jgi:hypothetical protein
MNFLLKTSETKKYVKIFCEAFLILKKYFASIIQDLFSFLQKRFLNPQAVRIRVKKQAERDILMKNFFESIPLNNRLGPN